MQYNPEFRKIPTTLTFELRRYWRDRDANSYGSMSSISARNLSQLPVTGEWQLTESTDDIGWWPTVAYKTNWNKNWKPLDQSTELSWHLLVDYHAVRASRIIVVMCLVNFYQSSNNALPNDGRWLTFYGHFCACGRLIGRATSKSNEAKSKMKHLSDIPTPRFELER